MTQDIVDINHFYASPIGDMVARTIERYIKRLSSDLNGKKVLILGFGIPYSNVYVEMEADIYMAMLSSFGVMYWPEEGDNRCVLCHEKALPFADQSFDHVLIVHAAEYASHLDGMMKETWRVLKGGGQLVVVAPNRGSIWSRTESMPFAHGRPFSTRQMAALLKSHKLMPESVDKALFFLPWPFCFEPRSARWLERWGRYLFLFLGGVIIASATKRLYAMNTQSGTPATWRVPVMVPKSLSSKS